jgi:hypothetical protein
MDAEMLKQMYGDEYPAAINLNGIRTPLYRETRFNRTYGSAEKRSFFTISRFLDGSAHFSFEKLKQELPEWSWEERNDFYLGAMGCDLSGQAGWPDLLRYIIANGGPDDWSMVAIQVAVQLPQDEAFELLASCLKRRGNESAANLTHAIAYTKHPEGKTVLGICLEEIWADPKLWDNDSFFNSVAFDATTCIGNLVSLGVSPEEFEDRIRALTEHHCQNNREHCRELFQAYFPWIEPILRNEFGEIIENSGE